MVREKSNGLLVVVSGPSGAGKGTICKKIYNDVIVPSISMTTRSPRDGEKDGIDYYFVSKKEFEENIDNDLLLEYATIYSGEYYGTPKKKVIDNIEAGRDVILEIDIQGALQINNRCADAIFVFVMPPSMKELKNRLVKRNTEDRNKIVERFKNAYQEINEVSKYNYVIINDDVDKACEKLKAIILSEKCRVDRIIDFDLNTKEELIHEILSDMSIKD